MTIYKIGFTKSEKEYAMNLYRVIKYGWPEEPDSSIAKKFWTKLLPILTEK